MQQRLGLKWDKGAGMYTAFTLPGSAKWITSSNYYSRNSAHNIYCPRSFQAIRQKCEFISLKGWRSPDGSDSGRAQWRGLRLKEQSGFFFISQDCQKCWLEAEGMQKVELEGETSGTPIKIGNEGMQTTCMGYLERGTNSRNPSCTPWSKLYVNIFRNRNSKTYF